MEQVTARINFIEVEINFIKIALGSLEDYIDENERKSFLKSKLSLIADETVRDQLKGYVRLSEPELKDLFKELQKERNLLQEEKLKLLDSSAGNHCFAFTLLSLDSLACLIFQIGI